MKSASSIATTASLKSSTNTQKIFIHWFRHQDLRLHDNPALYESIQASSKSVGKGILPIFCFDPRFVSGTTTTPFGSQKCSVRRAQFLLQSVQDLRTNLKQKGSGLVVALGKPEHVFANIIKECEHYCGLEKNLSIQVSCQEEVASEELSVDRAMDKILRRIDIPKSEVHVQGLVKVWGSTLYHPKDLPFAGGARGIPDIFTPFRTQVEKVGITIFEKRFTLLHYCIVKSTIF
jgi:deoxyribodipyrimidine photo-lyase